MSRYNRFLTILMVVLAANAHAQANTQPQAGDNAADNTATSTQSDQAAKAEDDEDVYPFIPRRDPRITDDARAAADLHYTQPDTDAVHARYGRFIAGINREWLVSAHAVHNDGSIPREPNAELCLEKKSALNKAVRMQPFSLHLAMAERHCALNASAEELALLDARVEANFARMAMSGTGESVLEPIAVFSASDALGFISLLGFKRTHEFFDSTSLQRVNYRVVAVLDSPDAPSQYRNFYFDLIGEDLAAGLDANRFSNYLSVYLLWTEALQGFSENYAGAGYLLEIASTGDQAAFKKLLEYPSSVEMAVTAMQLCSMRIDLKCPEHLLEPLLVAAEKKDPIALVWLANERIFGLLNTANAEEGMLLWEAAMRIAGSLVNLSFTVSVQKRAARVPAKVKQRLLELALQGDTASQFAYLFSLSQAEKARARSNKNSDLRRILNRLPSGPQSKFAKLTQSMFEISLNADDKRPGDLCEFLALVENSSMQCAEKFREAGNSARELDALLDMSVQFQTNGANLKKARAALPEALVRAGRLQDAADASIALLFDDVKVVDLDLMLLAGYRPSNISWPGIKKNMSKTVDLDVLRLQWDVSDKPNQALERMRTRCQREVLACHALMPLLFRLQESDRDAVIARASADDPSGKRSLGAELQARMALRSADPKKNLDGLQAFEKLANPSDAAIVDYLWLRCASPNAELAEPARSQRYLSTLFPKMASPEFAEIIAHCMSANNMVAAGMPLIEGALKSLIEDTFEPYKEQLRVQLKHLQQGKHVPAVRLTSKSLPILELADRATRWFAKQDTLAEFQLAEAELAKLTTQSTAAIGAGLEVRLENISEEPALWSGIDQIRPEPFFLREVREDRETIADGVRFCNKKQKKWLCDETKASTDLFYTSLEGYQLLSVETRTNQACGAKRCGTLAVHLHPTQTSIAKSAPSRLLMERQSIRREFAFDAKSNVLFWSAESNTVLDSRYNFSYGRFVENAALPTRCKQSAQDETTTDATESITDHGKQLEASQVSSPTLTTTPDDLKALKGNSVAEFLSQVTSRKLADGVEKSETEPYAETYALTCEY